MYETNNIAKLSVLNFKRISNTQLICNQVVAMVKWLLLTTEIRNVSLRPVKIFYPNWSQKVRL